MALPTHQLGRTGLQITRIGFGSWAVGGGGRAYGWGPQDDAESLATMRRALAEFRIEGIKTTIPLHREIFNHSAFIAGQVDTTFIERHWQKS